VADHPDNPWSDQLEDPGETDNSMDWMSNEEWMAGSSPSPDAMPNYLNNIWPGDDISAAFYHDYIKGSEYEPYFQVVIHRVNDESEFDDMERYQTCVELGLVWTVPGDATYYVTYERLNGTIPPPTDPNSGSGGSSGGGGGSGGGSSGGTTVYTGGYGTINAPGTQYYYDMYGGYYHYSNYYTNVKTILQKIMLTMEQADYLQNYNDYAYFIVNVLNSRPITLDLRNAIFAMVEALRNGYINGPYDITHFNMVADNLSAFYDFSAVSFWSIFLSTQASLKAHYPDWGTSEYYYMETIEEMLLEGRTLNQSIVSLQDIKPDVSITGDPKINCVYEKLMRDDMKNGLKQILTAFDNNTTYDVTFKVGPLPPGASGKTSYLGNNKFEITLSSSEASDAGYSRIWLAKTMIHEAFHAKLRQKALALLGDVEVAKWPTNINDMTLKELSDYFYKSCYEKGVWNSVGHDWMVNNLDLMVASLKEFVNTNYTTTSNTIGNDMNPYITLCLLGLEESPFFKDEMIKRNITDAMRGSLPAKLFSTACGD
jgi:hypothetical protein